MAPMEKHCHGERILDKISMEVHRISGCAKFPSVNVDFCSMVNAVNVFECVHKKDL